MFQPPRIEQFGLSRANVLDLDTLLARIESEVVARQAQLQHAAWTRMLEHRGESAFSFFTSIGDREC